MQTPHFDLLPVTLEDIPRLTDIHISACAPDNAIRLYFPTEDVFRGRVEAMLQQQIGDSSFTHTKVVDRETGEIAAWSCWVRTSYDLTPQDTIIDPSYVEPRPSDTQEQRENYNETAKPENTGLKKGNEFRFMPGLASYARAETDKAFKTWAQNRPHFQVKALFTNPRFQRRGIGTALVQHGNKVADTAGLPTLVQASPFGYPIYSANGFEVFGSLEADLREWAPNAQGNDRGYGNYSYRFMRREPGT